MHSCSIVAPAHVPQSPQSSNHRQIAGALIVGEETVKTHVGNILAKLHLAHRTQAMIYAFKQGWVSVDDLDVE